MAGTMHESDNETPELSAESTDPISPVIALRGKEWLEHTLEAVVGMWRDRATVDPVSWQRKLRREWEQNTNKRTRSPRKKSVRRR